MALSSLLYRLVFETTTSSPIHIYGLYWIGRDNKEKTDGFVWHVETTKDRVWRVLSFEVSWIWNDLSTNETSGYVLHDQIQREQHRRPPCGTWGARCASIIWVISFHVGTCLCARTRVRHHVDSVQRVRFGWPAGRVPRGPGANLPVNDSEGPQDVWELLEKLRSWQSTGKMVEVVGHNIFAQVEGGSHTELCNCWRFMLLLSLFMQARVQKVSH